MQELDPGHLYTLRVLDGGDNFYSIVFRFVKRWGAKYPGNKDSFPGTTLQEVLRACRMRLLCLNQQRPHWINPVCIFLTGLSIWLLEYRAARSHRRPIVGWCSAIFGPLCDKCLHAGCEGRCK